MITAKRLTQEELDAFVGGQLVVEYLRHSAESTLRCGIEGITLGDNGIATVSLSWCAHKCAAGWVGLSNIKPVSFNTWKCVRHESGWVDGEVLVIEDPNSHCTLSFYHVGHRSNIALTSIRSPAQEVA